jgi:hypothetical protein
MKPGQWWDKERHCWRPIVVAGKTITGEHYRPACADCPSLQWEHCKCWPADKPANSRINDLTPEEYEAFQLAFWKDAA